jgi:chromosome segregation ATPase
MGVKSIMKWAGDVLSPNDPELVHKTLTRLDEQDRWNDVFSTKLIELLDKQDGMRSDLRHKLTSAAAELHTATEKLARAEELAANAKQGFCQAEARVAAATADLHVAKDKLVGAENLATNAKRTYAQAEGRIEAATALLNRTAEMLQAAENLLQKARQQARRTTQFAWATAAASGAAVLCLSFAHSGPLLWTSRLAAMLLIVITSELMRRFK